MRQITTRTIQAAAVALLFGAAPALAFQESKVTAPPVDTKSAPLTPQLQPLPDDKPGIRLTAPESAGKDSKGVEIRLPGLGKLGVLPKVDFGLEILYGAAEDRRQGPATQPADETTVKGTIRHKF